ncbi:MAG: VanZ family protein, partial [Candidatus Acidoferrales bacterium]
MLSGSEFGTKTTYRWLQAVVEHFFPDISVATIVKVNAMARKLAHVTEYFILGLLLWRALRREA